MRPPTLDPTAGERARAIQEHPGAPQPNPDPTDPRCGERVRDTRQQAGARRVLDPTDPECAEVPA